MTIFFVGYLHRIHTKQGIWRAVEESDAETVEILLRSWVRVKASRNGQTLKNLAVATGKPKIIQLLGKYPFTNLSSTFKLYQCFLLIYYCF